MPVIKIEIAAGQTSEDQKKQLIRRLTSDAAEITGIPADRFITFINELPPENVGRGGKSVKEIMSGQ
jgi:4-oxalocrotonate tautomerase family enzyme